MIENTNNLTEATEAFRAEANAETITEASAEEIAGVTASTEENRERRFTQADIDKAVSARLERERKKYPAADELAALYACRDTVTLKEEELNSARKRAEDLQARLEALTMGVRSDALEDVLTLAAVYGRREGITAEVLGEVLTKYPQFAVSYNSGGCGAVPSTGIPYVPAVRETLSGVEEAFFERNPGMRD